MKYLEKVGNMKMEDIDLVATEIRNGKIAIFPTETVYGIGTSAFNEEACKRIYEIKQRPYDKPLIVLISDLEMLFEIVEDVNTIEKQLIEKFWPGPLTIIFGKKENTQLADVVTAGKSKIAIRMTNGKLVRELFQKAKVPIVAPSANLSGKPSGTKIANIVADLGDKVDYILDCGDIQDETVSTLVKVENGMIHILREGKIKKEALEQIARVEVKLH